MQVQERTEYCRTVIEEMISILQYTLQFMGGPHRFTPQEANAYSQIRSALRFVPLQYDEDDVLIDLIDNYATLDRIEMEVLDNNMTQGERYMRFIRPWVDLLDDLPERVAKQIADETAYRQTSSGRPRIEQADQEVLQSLRALRSLSGRMGGAASLSKHDIDCFDELRERLFDQNPSFLPSSLLKFRDANALATSIRNGSSSAASIDDEFADLIDNLGQPAREPVPSSDWTGRLTIVTQVKIIKQIVPQALQALDLLILEHEDRLHNRPDARDDQPLADLRRLHAELGALLRLADQGRPIKAALKRVEKVANRTLAFVAETREILISGSPAFGASAALSFAVIMALRAIYGEVGPVESATIIGGTTAGVLPLSKRRSQSRSKS